MYQSKSMLEYPFQNFEFLISKQPQTDYQKPLYVKCGSETSDQIGPPPIPEYELGDIREK